MRKALAAIFFSQKGGGAVEPDELVTELQAINDKIWKGDFDYGKEQKY